MATLKHLLGPIRLPFLILTPACVFLGWGAASWEAAEIKVSFLALALIGAVSAHISVNALNEYHDFMSGLDSRTERTPFSGGSGTLPARPDMASSALGIGVATLLLSVLIGLYLIYLRGGMLLPLGLLGILLVVFYTRWITRHPVLCLLAPGLGFGPVMVMGAHFVLTGRYSWTAFVASLVPLFLVSNLLLLNQFPDVDADKSVGRRHLPIVLGRRASSFIFCAIMTLAYLSIIVGVYLGFLPKASLLGLLTMAIALPVSIGAVRYADTMKKLLPVMGLNVVVTVATPVLVAIGFFL